MYAEILLIAPIFPLPYEAPENTKVYVITWTQTFPHYFFLRSWSKTIS